MHVFKNYLAFLYIFTWCNYLSYRYGRLEMARKVFVSYKYADTQVAPINDGSIESATRALFGMPTTARHYVHYLAKLLQGIEIYKGEEDGSDLSQFKDDTIWTKLKERISDSSITIVLISKGMKEVGKADSDQWIPWEISYSLRDLKNNATKGMLAVVLPEENSTYNHYFTYSGCQHCSSRTHHHYKLFDILKNNMFNRVEPLTSSCGSYLHQSNFHIGNDHSYIHQVEWHKFIQNPSYYLDIAEALRNNLHLFKLQRVV